jgi:hypothetical protein
MGEERRGIKNEIPTVLKEVRQNAEGLNLLVDVQALAGRRQPRRLTAERNQFSNRKPFSEE